MVDGVPIVRHCVGVGVVWVSLTEDELDVMLCLLEDEAEFCRGHSDSADFTAEGARLSTLAKKLRGVGGGRARGIP